MGNEREPNEHANEDPEPGELDAGLWDFDEDDEEFLAALEAEEEAAIELLQEALPELRGIEPPFAELEAASGRLRAGLAGGGWPYEHMARAAGWNDLPADDVERWGASSRRARTRAWTSKRRRQLWLRSSPTGSAP